MTKLFVAAVLVGTSFVSMNTAIAQSTTGPTTQFLCAAEASKQRLIPGSTARKAFIDKCVLAAQAKPSPAAAPVAPAKPIPARPASAPEVSPAGSKPTGLPNTPAKPGPKLSVAFVCSAEASKQRLVPGSSARKAFIDGCIARARPRPKV